MFSTRGLRMNKEEQEYRALTMTVTDLVVEKFKKEMKMDDRQAREWEDDLLHGRWPKAQGEKIFNLKIVFHDCAKPSVTLFKELGDRPEGIARACYSVSEIKDELGRDIVEWLAGRLPDATVLLHDDNNGESKRDSKDS